jgi:thiopeptide-type bacteriocin biosynthesis protein
MKSTDERCLYTLVHAPRERHDALLRALVTPVVERIREHPSLDSLFFARYDQPDWQLRFRVLGRPRWVEGEVRDQVAARLPSLKEEGLLDGWEFATYQREWERYGGEHGMRLSEQIFLHDSLACLDLLAAEARGQLARSRREYTLVYTERFLDLLGLDRAQRIGVYRKSYGWAVEGGAWSPRDLGLLEERYRGLEEGLRNLLSREGDDEAAFGGPVPAQIAWRCLDRSRATARALAEGLASGAVVQDPIELAWSLCHMHCNRIGIDVHGEAVLRYFACRLHEKDVIPLGLAAGEE